MVHVAVQDGASGAAFLGKLAFMRVFLPSPF